MNISEVMKDFNEAKSDKIIAYTILKHLEDDLEKIKEIHQESRFSDPDLAYNTYQAEHIMKNLLFSYRREILNFCSDEINESLYNFIKLNSEKN